MGLLEVMRVLRRHRLALIALVLVSVAAVGFVYVKVPPSYQSTADMILLPPNTAGGDGSGPAVKVNPYAGLGAQSTQVMASALAQVANGEQFRENERRQGVTSTVTVQVATLYGGGVVLNMTATLPHAEGLTNDLRSVSRLIGQELQRRQTAAGAPDGSLITINDLTSPTPAQPLSSNRTKLVIVAAVVGLIVTASLISILESMRRRRADRARQRRLVDLRSAGKQPPVGHDVPDDGPSAGDPAPAPQLGWSGSGATAR